VEGGLTGNGFFAGFLQKTFVFDDKTPVETLADLTGPVMGRSFLPGDRASVGYSVLILTL
jgi:hypothetical protein